MSVDFDELARRVRPDQLGQTLGLEKKNGSFRCPYHDDSDPSLSIFRRDGRVSFKCHACDASGTPVDLAARVWNADLPDAARRLGNLVGMRSGKDGSSDRRVEATYDYQDADGNLLFQVVRFEGKSFRQRRPDGDGGWIWNLNGVDPVPYRLPDVLRAIEAGEPVWVVEGEKDVAALEREGVVATCNPGGAGGWRDEFAEHLRGADVTVVADADDAGRRHARDVGHSLVGIASSVRIVEPASGSDAADHLEAGHGLDEDEFVSFTTSAEDDEDTPTPEADPGREPLYIDDLLAAAEHEQEYVAEPIIPKGCRGLWIGVPGAGKTGGIAQASVQLSAGADLFGYFKVERPHRVLSLFAQDDKHPIGSRVKSMLRGLGLDRDAVEDRLRAYCRPKLKLTDQDDMAWLEGEIRDHEAEVLLVDSYKYVRSGAETKNDDVDQNLMALSDLQRRTDITIVLVHHARKPSDSDWGIREVFRVLGAQAFIAWTNAALHFDVEKIGGSIDITAELWDVIEDVEPFKLLWEKEGAGDEAIGYLVHEGISDRLVIDQDIQLKKAIKRVEKYLKQHGPESKSMVHGTSSRSDPQCPGNTDANRRALNHLIEKEKKVVVEVEGNTHLCRWVGDPTEAPNENSGDRKKTGPTTSRSGRVRSPDEENTGPNRTQESRVRSQGDVFASDASRSDGGSDGK